MKRYLVSVVCCLNLMPAIMYAQAPLPYLANRTEYGQPDLQGNWEAVSLTLLERPPILQSLNISADQGSQFASGFLGRLPELVDPNFDISGAKGMATVNGQVRSSIITQPEDGLMPYTAKGVELVAWETERKQLFDHPEQRQRWERCLGGLGSPPIRMFFDSIPHKIVQNSDHVLIYTEDQGGARIIYLNEESAHKVAATWMGHSVGHWEGESLVVETANFQSVDPARNNVGRPLLIGANSIVKERFTRNSATSILYEFTVDDSDYYTQPWSGEFELNMIDAEIYEFACHEGNYSLPGILRGGQVEQARAN